MLIEFGDITIHQARCEDILPTLGSADMVLTDPPYRLDSPAFELFEPLCQSLYCFGDVNQIAERWFSRCRMPHKRLLVWHYRNSPKARGRWRSAMQGIIYGHRDGAPFDEDAIRIPYSEGAKKLHGRVRPSGGRLDKCLPYRTDRGALPRDVIEVPALTGHRSRERVGGHPDQKPIVLIEKLIRSVAPRSVIDPYMGTGTTLVACKRLGIPCIGIEAERKWCDIASQRLEAEALENSTVQKRLFDE